MLIIYQKEKLPNYSRINGNGWPESCTIYFVGLPNNKWKLAKNTCYKGDHHKSIPKGKYTQLKECSSRRYAILVALEVQHCLKRNVWKSSRKTRRRYGLRGFVTDEECLFAKLRNHWPNNYSVFIKVINTILWNSWQSSCYVISLKFQPLFFYHPIRPYSGETRNSSTECAQLFSLVSCSWNV